MCAEVNVYEPHTCRSSSDMNLIASASRQLRCTYCRIPTTIARRALFASLPPRRLREICQGQTAMSTSVCLGHRIPMTHQSFELVSLVDEDAAPPRGSRRAGTAPEPPTPWRPPTPRGAWAPTPRAHVYNITTARGATHQPRIHDTQQTHKPEFNANSFVLLSMRHARRAALSPALSALPVYQSLAPTALRYARVALPSPQHFVLGECAFVLP